MTSAPAFLPDLLPLEQINKSLTRGDHVLVVSGMHKGATGRVIGIGISSGYRMRVVATDNLDRVDSLTDMEVASIVCEEPSALRLTLHCILAYEHQLACPRLMTEFKDTLRKQQAQMALLEVQLEAAVSEYGRDSAPSP